MTIYTIIEKLPEWVENDFDPTETIIIGYFLDLEIAEETMQLLRDTEEEKAKEEFQGEWRKWAKRYLLTEKTVATSAEDFVANYLAENARVMGAVSEMSKKLHTDVKMNFFDFNLDDELGFSEDSDADSDDQGINKHEK